MATSCAAQACLRRVTIIVRSCLTCTRTRTMCVVSKCDLRRQGRRDREDGSGYFTARSRQCGPLALARSAGVRGEDVMTGGDRGSLEYYLKIRRYAHVLIITHSIPNTPLLVSRHRVCPSGHLLCLQVCLPRLLRSHAIYMDHFWAWASDAHIIVVLVEGGKF